MLIWIIVGGMVLILFLFLGMVAYAMVRVGALSDQREFLEEAGDERRQEHDGTDTRTTVL